MCMRAQTHERYGVRVVAYSYICVLVNTCTYMCACLRQETPFGVTRTTRKIRWHESLFFFFLLFEPKARKSFFYHVSISTLSKQPTKSPTFLRWKTTNAPIARAHEWILFCAPPSQKVLYTDPRAPEARAEKVWTSTNRHPFLHPLVHILGGQRTPSARV